MVALVLVVGALLLMLGSALSAGFIYWPVSSLPFNLTPAREGIELAAIPLAAVVAAVLRPPSDRIEVLRAGRIGHWLPLLAAGALGGLVCFLIWSWHWSWHRDEGTVWQGTLSRAVWTVLAVPSVYALTVLYPRLMATLAGAIGLPALFGIVALGFPESLVRSLEAHHGHRLYFPRRMSAGPEGVFIMTAGATVAIALLAAALLAARFSVWPRSLCYAAVSGAIMFCLAVYGYVWILATLD